MLFNLENDTGDRITGYLVPDAFSAVPTLRVMSGGSEVLVFAANEIRESVIAAGRHESGRCGFSIDDKALPKLREMQDLSIFDHETGVLIYRRPIPSAIKKKIIRLETHLFPLWQLDDAIGGRFQYYAKGIENLGSETVTQLFLLNKIPSVYLSGRILYRNYAYFIEDGFETVILLQEPYEELAERLMVLSKIKRIGGDGLGLRDSFGMRDAIDFAEELIGDETIVGDEKALKRIIRTMPQDVAATLSNPLVRELTASTPDEMPGRSAVASALDRLASAAVLGVRSDPGLFRQALAEFLGIDVQQLPPIRSFDKVQTLAAALKATGAIDIMLEKDLEVYHHVTEAHRKLVAAYV